MVSNQSRARQMLEAIEEQRAQVGRLRRNVRMLENKCSGRVSRYGATGGSAKDPHPELWDTLADEQLRLRQKEQYLSELEKQVDSWIDLLPRPRWRMVLRCHYLDGMELSELARVLSKDTGRDFSNHQIYRFHRQALEAAEEIWPMS